MAFSFDFLGFGSKRKTAFRLLDLEWEALDIDVRQIDNGVRQLLYQWTLDSIIYEKDTDQILLDLANFSGFLMRGPERAERALGREGAKKMNMRLKEGIEASAQDHDTETDTLDVKIIKLILAAGLADSEIEELISLDERF